MNATAPHTGRRIPRITPEGSSESVQDYMAALVKDKIVLDVGCVEHEAEREGWDTWLHKHLCRTAASVTGLDYNAEGVATLNKKGYNIICADAMTTDLGTRYDIVTMGEIIEHVENPGLMLRNMRRHLKPGGNLIVTTPNAFFAMHFVESLISSPYDRWNDEHVQWFDYFTLGNMFQRCGFTVNRCLHFARSRKTRKVLKSLGAKCPQFLASTVMMIGSASESDPA